MCKNSFTVIVFHIFFLIDSGKTFGQKDFTLYQTQGAFQQIYVNPAAQPDAKIHIGLPLMSNFKLGLSNSGFSLSNLVALGTEDSIKINSNSVLNNLNLKNYLTFDTQIDLFSLGFYIGKTYLNFNISERSNFQFRYTGDLPRLLVEGNGGSLLGNRASFNKSALNLNIFREIGLGFSTPVNNNLTVGARAKILLGHFNITTKNASFGMHTNSETYALTFDGSASINTAGLQNLDLPNLTPLDIFFNNDNIGFAIDLGADYKINDKLSLSASFLDFGFIAWSSNVTNYNITDFNYTISEAEIIDFIGGNTSSLEDVLDTLGNQLKAYKTKNSYTSGLYTRFFLGGHYQLNENINLGTLLYNEFIANSLRQAISFSGGFKLKDFLTLTTNYTVFSRSYSNIGLGLILRGGPVQFLVLSDNINLAFTSNYAKNFHIRFGLNLVIGKKPETD